MQTKCCSECLKTKDITEYHLNKNTFDGRTGQCKVCRQLKTKDYYRRNSEAVKNKTTARRFNLTLDEVSAIFLLHGNRCAICGEEETTDKRLAIDHCHITGKIRGLLCSNHNTGLGKFGDSIELLEEAIKYLKERG